MRRMEFGRGILQDALQSVPLVEDRQHRGFDLADEKADRVSASHKGFALAQAASYGYDED